MARPKSPGKHYTEDEINYIKRVAGKVPVSVIAQTLSRTKLAIRQWAYANGIHLRVPHSIMIKHWRENENTKA